MKITRAQGQLVARLASQDYLGDGDGWITGKLTKTAVFGQMVDMGFFQPKQAYGMNENPTGYSTVYVPDTKAIWAAFWENFPNGLRV